MKSVLVPTIMPCVYYNPLFVVAAIFMVLPPHESLASTVLLYHSIEIPTIHLLMLMFLFVLYHQPNKYYKISDTNDNKNDDHNNDGVEEVNIKVNTEKIVPLLHVHDHVL